MTHAHQATSVAKVNLTMFTNTGTWPTENEVFFSVELSWNFKMSFFLHNKAPSIVDVRVAWVRLSVGTG